MNLARSLTTATFAAVALLASACTPKIGDACQTAQNCSINGDRVCDRARPNGACTIYGCEADTCPDDAICVRWRPDPARLSFNACMRRCDDNGGCRVDDGYECIAVEDIRETAEGGDNIAEIVDMEPADQDGDGRIEFCVATSDPTAEED